MSTEVKVSERISLFEKMKSRKAPPPPKRQTAVVSTKVHAIEGLLSLRKREHVHLAHAGLPEPFDLTGYIPPKMASDAGHDSKPVPNQPSYLSSAPAASDPVASS